MSKVINIVICYENEEEVIEYANNLSKQSSVEHIGLVIVINKEGQLGENYLRDEIGKINFNIDIFNPGNNLGYMNGLIYGYKAYVNMHLTKPQWVVMSNTDIAFRNNEFFSNIIEKKYCEDIWCIAPSVYSSANNSYENPQCTERYTLKGLNRRIYIFEHPNLAYIYIKLAEIKSKVAKRNKKSSQYVYSAHGCFFIIKGDFAELLREKKYGALMYSEEAYIAEIIRANKKKCFYDSTIEVVHNESSVTGKLKVSKKCSYIANSLKIVRDEFFC